MTDVELICLYIRDQLPEPGKSEFEKRLNDEPELLKEYTFQKELRESILEEEVMELREQLREIDNNSELQKKVRYKMRIGGMTMISAFLTVVLLLSVIYHQKNTSPDTDQLFSEYYQPYKSIVSVRSETSTSNTLEKEAFKHYSFGRWKKSKECLEALISKESDNALYQFYIGIVELELGNIEASIHHFNEAIELNNPMFTPQSYWYSAMAYMKMGEIDKTAKRLEWIVQKERYKHYEAQVILKKIDGRIFSW
jgi:tetratricopeptide (TPR) repeat protein